MITAEKITFYNKDNEEAFSYIYVYLTIFGYIVFSKRFLDGEYTKDTHGVRFESLLEFD